MWIVESDLLSKKSTVRFRLVDLFDDQIGHRPIPTTPAFAGYTHSLEKREKTHVKIGSRFWPRILQFLSVVFPQSKSTAWPSTRGIVTKFGRRNGFRLNNKHSDVLSKLPKLRFLSVEESLIDVRRTRKGDAAGDTAMEKHQCRPSTIQSNWPNKND